MSSNEIDVQRGSALLAAARRRAVLALLAAVLADTGLVIFHFAYGARLYDEPQRLHVVLPALTFAALAFALGGSFLWRPRPLTRWLLSAEVGFAYIALFGGYHGAFSHAAKDLLFLLGVSAARLQSIFDSPDFALPNDLLFEATGWATFLAALVVLRYLVRLHHLPDDRRERAPGTGGRS